MLFKFSMILAQAIPPDTSFLGWMVTALSTISTVLVLVAAGMIFVGAFHLVAKKRSPSSLASYLILLPLPAIISICGWIYGSIASLSAIATSPDLVITNQGIAGGLASSLLSVLFAILVSLPTYVVLAYGLLFREFRPPTHGYHTNKNIANGPSPSAFASNATAIPITASIVARP